MSRYYKRCHSPLSKITLKVAGMGMSAIAFIAGVQVIASHSEEWSINIQGQSTHTETLNVR